AAERGLDWWVLDDELHAGVQRLVQDMNGAYRDRAALWELDSSPDGFGWIDANDAAGNTLSFLRLSRSGDVLACVANFSGAPHHGYRIGLPSAGRWREVINTDAGVYGGSGVGNLGAIEATGEPHPGRPTEATAMPCGARCRAIDWPNAFRPALLAPYAGCRGSPRKAPREVTLMIRPPPRGIMCRTAHQVALAAPTRLTPSASCQAACHCS